MRTREWGPPVSLIEISRVLEETARLVRQHAEPCDELAGASAEGPAAITAARVRSIIAVRWLRREFLGLGSADPAWSLMLELYASRLEGQRLSLSRLAIAAGVPKTTALYLTRRLVAAGLLIREQGPDRRVALIGLSDAAARRMRAYLAAALKVSPLGA